VGGYQIVVEDISQVEVLDAHFSRLWTDIQASVSDSIIENALSRAQLREDEQDWNAAVESYQEALAFLIPAELPAKINTHTADICFRFALCLRRAARWSEALDQQKKTCAMYRQLGNLPGKASVYMEMGHIYHLMNVYDLALLYYREAYYLFRAAATEASDRVLRWYSTQGMADSKESSGNLSFQLRLLPQGLNDLREAQQLYLSLGMPDKVAAIIQTLENAQVAKGVNHV